MDLETFVENALAQIDSALRKASSKNPEKYNYTYWRNASWNEVIDFEVQVYASDTAWANGGFWINVAWINVWTKWELATSNHEQSVIRFSVERKNTPKQNKIENDEWKKHNQLNVYSPDDNQPY